MEEFYECEYGEIPFELIDAFLEKLENNKDKAPCLHQALITAKAAGGFVEICF